MSYVERVIEQVKTKNPNEPEFIQAVTEVLTSLEPVFEAHPEYVNEDPVAKGWMIKIRLDGALNPELLDAAAYEAHVASESH